MKYFLISGESSGDYISSLIAKELIHTHGAEIVAMGGPHLAHAGAEIIQDISDIKVMGWQSVIGLLPKFIKILNRIKKAILAYNPDTIILVDFGSFNLRLAKWCKNKGYNVVYLIPPKVWASRESRIDTLRKYCDKIIVLYPFEKKYFESKGVNVDYFGHPLADLKKQIVRDSHFHANYKLNSKPIIALLPGSRPQEISYMLSPMLKAAAQFPMYQLCISQTEGITTDQLKKFIPKSLNDRITIISGNTHQLLLQSNFAIITSGTATLESALIGTPMIVCYKTSLLNYMIAKRIIRVPYISLPNLILDAPLIPELLQEDCNPQNIVDNINQLITSTQHSSQIVHFGRIYDNLCNINSAPSIAKAINNQG